jgi:hypothetical protein
MKKLLKKITIAIILICNTSFLFAQLASSNDNTEYGIAKKISDKAVAKKLGAIHSESPKMRPTAGKGGYFLRYEKGWVYYNPKLYQAFAIWGETMKKYQAANFETGWLGFPTTDPKNTPNRTGTYQHFDGGSIYYSPTTGYHYIAGAFKDYWANIGWENSTELGFPKTDEVEIFIDGYTRYQQFEKGTLFFGPGKEVLYSNNPNASTPPQNTSSKSILKFEPTEINSGGDKMIDSNTQDLIDLYGWMDIRVYKGNGKEIVDESNKSFSLFYIPEKNRIDGVRSETLGFVPTNINMLRMYNITQADIDANAYIRITYWLNDHDDTNSNDYLKLQPFDGTWNYNKGNHPYREIKLKDIQRSNNQLKQIDHLTDGSENIWLTYNLKIVSQ